MTLNPVVQDITADQARHLTDRIKVAVEGTWQLVVEAYQARAWVALGYSTWDDYCTREFGTSRLRLPRETRREEIGSLREAGLSLRAIETATGVSKKTIIRDLREVVESTPPAPEPQEAARSVVAAAFAQRDEAAAPPKVTGLDGKTYAKPVPATPKAPARRALPDQFFDASYDLQKVVERIARLAADDRFPQNKEQISAKHRADLLRGIDALQGVVDRLPQPQPKGTNNDQQ